MFGSGSGGADAVMNADTDADDGGGGLSVCSSVLMLLLLVAEVAVEDALWLLLLMSADAAAETTVALVELLLAESSKSVSEPGRRAMGTRGSNASDCIVDGCADAMGDGFDGEVDG